MFHVNFYLFPDGGTQSYFALPKALELSTLQVFTGKGFSSESFSLFFIIATQYLKNFKISNFMPFSLIIKQLTISVVSLATDTM